MTLNHLVLVYLQKGEHLIQMGQVSQNAKRCGVSVFRQNLPPAKLFVENFDSNFPFQNGMFQPISTPHLTKKVEHPEGPLAPPILTFGAFTLGNADAGRQEREEHWYYTHIHWFIGSLTSCTKTRPSSHVLVQLVLSRYTLRRATFAALSVPAFHGPKAMVKVVFLHSGEHKSGIGS